MPVRNRASHHRLLLKSLNYDDADHAIPTACVVARPFYGLLIIAVIIFFICLILLDLISGFLVDWLWFSADRLFCGVLDDHIRQSRGILRRLFGDHHHPVGETERKRSIHPQDDGGRQKDGEEYLGFGEYDRPEDAKITDRGKPQPINQEATD